MKDRFRRLERDVAARRALRHPPQVCVRCVHAATDGRPPGVHPVPANPDHADVVFDGDGPDPAVFAALERAGRLRPGGYKVVVLGVPPTGFGQTL